MWGRKKKSDSPAPEEPAAPPNKLKDAIRQARIETAQRTGVVVDMRDAEAARLELLNDALDPVFADIPPEVELFDRGVSKGEVPRLWIDATTHVAMGRDKRIYRFVQDTRYGRRVLLESPNVADMAEAITRYVAARLVERERALADIIDVRRAPQKRSGWRAFGAFLLGIVIGAIGILVAAMLLSQP